MTRGRVLVVDDSAPNRLVATGHLEAEGFEVVEADSGEEALDVLAVQPFDLVVLDVLMPGLGGFETCKRIRQTPALVDLPVLFLTALGDRETTGPAIDAGADDLLAKPFYRPELMLRVNALIRQRRTALELRRALADVAAHNKRLHRDEADRRRLGELVVHDLKSPLAAIIGNVEVLLDTELSDDQRETLDDIAIAAHQIDSTARDLLDLSRSEATALAPRLAAFDLGDLIGEVAASQRVLARFTDVAIESEITVGQLIADRELIRRLVQNLVHNAVKHAPPRSRVLVSAGAEAGAAVIRVVDEGPGVPAADTERIFEHYVSLEGVGHGLGLAFCRLAAEAHGGRIWVERREPHGAVFCVRLPQA